MRMRLSMNEGWRFAKGDPPKVTTRLNYGFVKDWLLPTGNSFLKEPARKSERPDGTDGHPGIDVAYTAPDFDDSGWRQLDLPHDYAIEGPFETTISGSTGRLPSSGIAL